MSPMLSPFPLHRLPALALDEIGSHLNFFEKLYISKQCRINWWTKRMPIQLKIHPSDISTTRDNHVIFELDDEVIQFNIKVPTKPIKNPKKWWFGRCWTEEDTIYQSCAWKSSRDKGDAFIAIINFLVGTFNVEGISFDFQSTKPKDAYKLLGHAIAIGLEFHSVYWGMPFSSLDDFEQLAKCSEQTSEIIVKSYILNDFQLDSEVLKKCSARYLKLDKASSFTLENICAFENVSKICLKQLTLSDKELNTLFKKWIDSSLNFNSMKLTLKNYNITMEKMIGKTKFEEIPSPYSEDEDTLVIKRDNRTYGKTVKKFPAFWKSIAYIFLYPEDQTIVFK